MPRPAPISDAERDSLRRLFLDAPGREWTAPLGANGPAKLFAETDRGQQLLATFDYGAGPQLGQRAAELAAASRNALPRLFAEIDELRARSRGVPVLGFVS